MAVRSKSRNQRACRSFPNEIIAEGEDANGKKKKIVIEADGPDWRANMAVLYGAVAHPRNLAHELSRVIMKQLLQYWAAGNEPDEEGKYKIVEDSFILHADVLERRNEVAAHLYFKCAWRGAAILHIEFKEGDEEEYIVANRGGEDEALELIFNIKTKEFFVRGGRRIIEVGGGSGFWSNTIWQGMSGKEALERYRNASYEDITAKSAITIADLKYM